MIFADKNRKDIIGQYIAFCVILKEQIKINNLSAYLKCHEKEVEDYMFATLSQEEIIEDMVSNAKSEGQVEKAVEIAKNMLARNQFAHDEIASMTGLSVREVSNLANKE